MRTLAVVAAAVALAGCLDPASLLGANEATMPPAPEWAVDAEWALRALPFGDGHDHKNLSQHRNLSTPNWEIVGWDPLVTDYHGSTAGGYSCAEVTRQSANRTVAWVNSGSTDVAMVGVDVTDPSRPTKIGELAIPAVDVYDLTVTPDGKYVILGTVEPDMKRMPRDPPRNLTAGLLGGSAPSRCRADAFAPALAPAAAAPEDSTPYFSGLILVDVADPAQPRVVDYLPQPVRGSHSVFSTTIDNRTLVLSSNLNGLTTFDGLPPTAPTPPIGSMHAPSYFSFLEVVDGKLRLLSVYKAPPDPMREPVRGGHLDGTIAKHPLTGETLAYLADWDGGLSIVDVTEPTQPTLVARWNEYRFNDDLLASGNIHQAVPMAGVWSDGRHYSILGQEFAARPAHTPTGQIFILDTTDPAAPAWVSSWTLPVDLVWSERLLFSLHYYHLDGTILFVSAYHAGLWALDLSDLTQPRSLGVFLPDRESPEPAPADVVRYYPQVMEVLPGPDGTLVTFDDGGGAYTLRFLPEVPVPLVEEWPIIPPEAS